MTSGFTGKGPFTGITCFLDFLEMAPIKLFDLLKSATPLDDDKLKNLENPLILGLDIRKLGKISDRMHGSINDRLEEDDMELMEEELFLRLYKARCRTGEIYDREAVEFLVNKKIQAEQVKNTDSFDLKSTHASYELPQDRIPGDVESKIKKLISSLDGNLGYPGGKRWINRIALLEVADNVILPCYKEDSTSDARILLPSEDIFVMLCVVGVLCPKSTALNQKYFMEHFDIFHRGFRMIRLRDPIIPLHTSGELWEKVKRAESAGESSGRKSSGPTSSGGVVERRPLSSSGTVATVTGSGTMSFGFGPSPVGL
ncbi:MAG: hypothetical protein SGARI_004762, partial [Bacillariaceae sp.]